ncbi:MAG: serine/threonine-protein phosphatase [Bacteroides sp.]|nr:serine/threonine-protein phosphatase [Bacteroides sp.]
MRYILRVYCISEFGQRKDAQGNPHQEDSVYPAVGTLTDDARTFILCDGMGGHEAGEVASATVCESMGASVANDGHDKNGIFTPIDFSNALTAAFDALDEKDNGAAKKMGTTMTFLKLHNDGAMVAHIGDSRVYHIRPGKTGEDTRIMFATEDHSLINDLIKIGELTREEARFSKQKNVITRAMQPNMEQRPNADVHNITDIKAGDYFYMCSDGMLEEPEMENGESLRNIFSEKGGDDENKVQILRSVTEDNKDNHTAFVIHILDVIRELVSPARMAVVEDVTPVEVPKPVVNKGNAGKNEKVSPSVNKGKGGLIGFLVGAVAVATMVLCYNVFKPKSDNKQELQEKLDRLKDEIKEDPKSGDEEYFGFEINESQASPRSGDLQPTKETTSRSAAVSSGAGGGSGSKTEKPTEPEAPTHPGKENLEGKPAVAQESQQTMATSAQASQNSSAQKPTQGILPSKPDSIKKPSRIKTGSSNNNGEFESDQSKIQNESSKK